MIKKNKKRKKSKGYLSLVMHINSLVCNGEKATYYQLGRWRKEQEGGEQERGEEGGRERREDTSSINVEVKVHAATRRHDLFIGVVEEGMRWLK